MNNLPEDHNTHQVILLINNVQEYYKEANNLADFCYSLAQVADEFQANFNGLDADNRAYIDDISQVDWLAVANPFWEASRERWPLCRVDFCTLDFGHDDSDGVHVDATGKAFKAVK